MRCFDMRLTAHGCSGVHTCVNPFHFKMETPNIPRLNIVFNAVVDGLPPHITTPPDLPQ